MATKKSSGGFAQMPKMMTDEPSVILKLKKGGHVAKHKAHEEHGHKAMHHTEHHKKHHAEHEKHAEHGEAPKKPSMAERRKAMSGALLNSKHGGKVHKKAMGGMMGAPAAPMAAAPMAAPMDPRKVAMARAMMARRAPAAPMGGAPMGAMKKGGKVSEKKEIHKLEKELKHHEQEKDSMHGGKAHMKHGGKVHHKAAGGSAMDKFETKTTIEGNAKKFDKTKVVDGKHHDKHHGTGDIKEGKPAGYKHGGHAHKMHKFATGGAIPADTHEKANKGKSKMKGAIEGNEHDYVNTEMHQGKRDKAHGTKGIKEGQPAGYKKGGAIGWENRPADDGEHFDSAHGTKGVRESNAGGYKKGGAAKKHYATGGSVNDTGRAVAMPKHFVSKPVSNTAQSGTFKKGGRVEKFDGGSTDNDALQDLSNGDYDKFYANERQQNERDRDAILGAPGRMYDAAKRLLGVKPGAGAGRGMVNPPMARKRGGSAKC
jgi:hypothetical protein